MGEQRNRRKTQIKLADRQFQSEVSIYNRDQRYITANVADLQLRLRDFKLAVKKEGMAVDLIALLGLWLPVFTSDFKGVSGISPDMVMGVYITIAVLFTLSLGRRLMHGAWIKSLSIFLVYFPNSTLSVKIKEYFISNETNPDRLVEKLCEKDK